LLGLELPDIGVQGTLDNSTSTEKIRVAGLAILISTVEFAVDRG
jgi:hypothetical protein